MKWIGVLDCNNFFVSCERLFRPDLWGKPAVVLSSNDGCVVARSQEVKDMGVPMGVPYFQIKDTLQHNAVSVFSSNFTLYRDISRRVFEVMREELEIVEQYSIDEAFFSLDIPDPYPVITRLQKRVEQLVGIPVSIGVAATKTQAKYANDRAKKSSGVFVHTPATWQADADSIPLPAIWGVGGRLERRYKAYKLHTVADVLAADPARITRLFGVVGLRLRDELAGRAVYTIGLERQPQKSVMSSRSFRTETTSMAVVADAVAYHTRHAVADVRAMGLELAVLRVYIQPSRHGDFVLRGRSGEAVFTVPTNDTLACVKAAYQLLETLFEPGVPYKKAGVMLAGLQSAGRDQLQLFADTSSRSASTTAVLMQTIDGLNTKAGTELIQIGTRLKGKQWSARIDARSPAFTTQWNEIATAKT